MNNSTKTSLVKTLQKEYVRRSLNQYFEEKGYDNFLVKPYPPTLMDLADRIPVFGNMIEVKYFLEDIDMSDGSIKVGWNVFVLGSKRIFLGYTIHGNLNDIDNRINDVNETHDGPIELKSVIESMVEFIGESNKVSDIYKKLGIDQSSIDSIRPNEVSTKKPIPNFSRKV